MAQAADSSLTITLRLNIQVDFYMTISICSLGSLFFVIELNHRIYFFTQIDWYFTEP